MEESLGERLKAKRKALKMSVPKLAEHLQISQDKIYKWEKGTRPSDLEDLKKLERFINPESVDYLKENELHTPTVYNTQQNMIDDLLHTKNELIDTQRKLIASLESQINYSQDIKEIKYSLNTISRVLYVQQEKGTVNYDPFETEEDLLRKKAEDQKKQKGNIHDKGIRGSQT